MANEPIDVRVTILLPDAPRARRGSTRALTPEVRRLEPDPRGRRLPAQPPGVPAGQVWAGPDDGLVPYSGVKPRPGDLIFVHGGVAQRYVTSPLAAQPLRWPTFVAGCRCRCLAATGTAFLLSYIRSTPVVLALEVGTNTVTTRALFGTTDSWLGRAIAVDTASPFDLYVLDDLRYLHTPANIGDTTTRAYFDVVRFRLTGGAYALLDRVALVDPSPTTITTSFSEPLMTDPASDTDPPSFRTNCLSVVEGVPLVSLHKAPARYVAIEAGVPVTHTLTLNGSPYAKGLRGNIVTVPDRPARRTDRLVLACDAGNVNFVLLRFNTSDEILEVLDLGAFSAPRALSPTCNQVLALNTANATPMPEIIETEGSTTGARLILTDFCRGFKVRASFDPGAEVDPALYTPLGLAPLGCLPLYTHRRNAASFILSQLAEETGRWQRGLVTSATDTSGANLQVSGLLATLRGQTPLAGSATVPASVPLPQYDVTYQVGAFTIAHEVNNAGVALPAGTTFWRMPTAALFFGVQQVGLTKDLFFRNGARWELVTITHHANNVYDLQFQFPYSPEKEPLTTLYNVTSGYYFITKSIASADAQQTSSGGPPLFDARVYALACAPALIDTNGTITESTLQSNGPSLSRKLSQYRTGPFTMPDFGQTAAPITRDINQSHFKARFCIYGTPRVTNVLLNGLSGTHSAVTLPRLVNDGTKTVYPDHTFTQLWEFEVDGNETSYTYEVSNATKTITFTNANLDHVGGLADGVKAFEGYADIFPTGAPEPDYY